MPLSSKDPIAKWIDDFKKSDAPQFKGKSGEDRKAMAIAAYMDAKKGSKQEKGWDSTVNQVESNKEECWKGYRAQGMKKKGGKMVPNCVPESAAIATPSSQEFIPSPTGGKRFATAKVEEIETDSAAKRPVTVTDPRTGKKSVRMQPAHKKELDHDHKKEVGEKTNNLVAKHARTYNKAHVMTNRKKAQKKGYVKHKGKMYEEVSFCESMDPRDHTDKPGHLVVVTKPTGKKMIKHYHPTAQGAKKYADRINRTNRVGHKATVHKTDGRRIMESGSEDVVEFLVVKKNPSFSGSTSSSSSSSSSRRGGSASGTSGQSVTTTSGNGYKISRNIKTGKTTKSRYNVGGKKKMKEGKEDLQELSPETHKSYQQKAKKSVDKLQTKYTNAQIANRASKSNMNKLDKKINRRHAGISKSMDKHESVEVTEATSQKLLNKMKELAPKGQLPRNSVELRKLKARAKDELRKATKAKKAAPKKQSTTKTSTGKKHMGSMEAGDRNIVMQLRKAQDLKGNHDIIVSPKGRTVRLPKTMIDKLLKRFETLQKPQDKRRFQIMVTKELRKRAK